MVETVSVEHVIQVRALRGVKYKYRDLQAVGLEGRPYGSVGNDIHDAEIGGSHAASLYFGFVFFRLVSDHCSPALGLESDIGLLFLWGRLVPRALC